VFFARSFPLYLGYLNILSEEKWFALKVLHKFTSKCVPNDGVIFQDIHCKFLPLSYTIPWNGVITKAEGHGICHS